jgi:GT2 family glycosyltransferase
MNTDVRGQSSRFANSNRLKTSFDVTDISVVIPTVLRRQSLIRCIDSVLDQDSALPREIVIVSSSKLNIEEEKTILYRYRDSRFRFKLLYSDMGNVQIQKWMGVEASSGKIICFLDDDVVLDNGFLINVTKAFSENKVEGVQPLVISHRTDKGFRKLMKRFTLLNTDSGPGRFLRSGFPAMPFDKTTPIETKIMIGCSCYLKDVLTESVFDFQFGVTHLWEDVWLSARVSRNGAKYIYYPYALMTHFHEPGGRRTTKSIAACYLFNHYLLWNEFCRDIRLDRLAYYWAKIWAKISLSAKGIQKGELREVLEGFRQGETWIKRYSKDGKMPEYEEISFVQSH